MTNILVFDSGIGGLSVVSHMRKTLPGLHIDYIADDTFKPYGEKTESQLKSRLPELLRTLEIMLMPDIVVLACNTASTAALTEIRNMVHCPVIGVVPAIKPAAEQSKTIAVLGTPGTVRRKYVGRLINDFAADCNVILHGSSKLVLLAERKMAGENIDKNLIAKEIAPLKPTKNAQDPDIIVLACTHFPLLAEEIMAEFEGVKLIDSGAAIARRVKHVLAQIKPKQKKPAYPQTAFSIGGEMTGGRKQMFANYGFEKFVIL